LAPHAEPEATRVSGNRPNLPSCSRLLSSYELAAHLRNAWSLAVSVENRADAHPYESGNIAEEALKALRDEASRHRDFFWTVRQGDRVWLTVDAPRHPECDFGASYLVVVRAGKVVLRYRIPSSAASGVIVPMLPISLRLTQDHVINAACEWVRSRYAVVPPVALVLELSEETILKLERDYGYRIPSEEREAYLNKWWVSFARLRDMDEPGMPAAIHVVVDDLTGEVNLAETGEADGHEPPSALTR
jgi:hypothetical protein